MNIYVSLLLTLVLTLYGLMGLNLASKAGVIFIYRQGMADYDLQFELDHGGSFVFNLLMMFFWPILWPCLKREVIRVNKAYAEERRQRCCNRFID